MYARFAILAVLVAMLGLIAPLSAETFKHAGANIQLDVPDAWTTKAEGDVLQITSDDETLYIAFWVAEEDSLDEVAKELDKELDKVLGNIKHEGDLQHIEINGLHAVVQDGTATVDEGKRGWAKVTEVEFSVAVIMSKKPVLVLAFGEKGKWNANEDDVAKLFKSVKAIE